MKSIKQILSFSVALILMSCTALFGQTQTTLPTGSKAYSSNIFIAPSQTLWTGKSGSYTALANKQYVDSISNANIGIVNPSALSISNVFITPNEFRLPSVKGGTTPNTWFTNGIVASPNYTGNGLNAIPIRVNGRLKIASGVLPDEAVTRNQLDSLVLSGPVQANNFRDTVTFSPRSLILNSSNVSISGTNLESNLILGSQTSSIKTNVRTSAIIASKDSRILGDRYNSAIIASEGALIDRYNVGDLFKWNSAIIASKLGVIKPSNSYTLVTGKGTISNGSAQMVVGQNNLDEPSRSVDDPLKKSFIVGNGTGSDDTQPTVRSNAFHVTQGGKVWVQNELEIDNPNGVILKAPNGNRYRITVSNTGVLSTTQL